jgi:hypothetical protein
MQSCEVGVFHSGMFDLLLLSAFAFVDSRLQLARPLSIPSLLNGIDRGNTPNRGRKSWPQNSREVERSHSTPSGLLVGSGSKLPPYAPPRWPAPRLLPLFLNILIHPQFFNRSRSPAGEGITLANLPAASLQALRCPRRVLQRGCRRPNRAFAALNAASLCGQTKTGPNDGKVRKGGVFIVSKA